MNSIIDQQMRIAKKKKSKPRKEQKTRVKPINKYQLNMGQMMPKDMMGMNNKQDFIFNKEDLGHARKQHEALSKLKREEGVRIYSS